MEFNSEQTKAIYGEEPLIVVSAGAGSGKTRILTERYVHLCELKFLSEIGQQINQDLGAEVNEIITLTFTEDAALEMKSRIRKRLLEKLEYVEIEYPHHVKEACRYWRKQLESMDTAIISTFHSFCQRILQENSLEADIYPSFQVLDDIQSNLLKSDIFSEIYAEAEREQKWPELLSAIYKKVLQESLFSVYGKVREYELWGSLKETLKAETLASSWRAELNQGLIDFEAAFYHFFQSYPNITKLSPAYRRLYEALYNVFRKNLHGEELLTSLQTELKTTKSVKTNLMAQNRDFYDLLHLWFSIPDFSSYSLMERVLLDFEDLIIHFDGLYEQRKRESACLDFSDLQQKAIQLMENLQIQNFYSSKFKHFLVDEMQDTNRLQLRMIDKVNPSYCFIVGDGKQSIYRFRGADVEIFNGLIHEAKESSRFSFIDMNTNYRTCDSIIQCINLLFQQDELMGLEPRDSRPLYKTAYTPMIADRNGGRETKNRVEYIKISEEQDKSPDQNQYVMLSRRMVELKKEEYEIYDPEMKVWRPVEWRDMAILIASRTNLTTLELAMKAYDIPYNVYGGLGFFDRQEVVDFLSLLQWLNKPYEPLYMMALLRGPLFGVTMDEFMEIQQTIEEDMSFSSFIYEKHFINLNLHDLQFKLENFCDLFEKWVPFHWTSSNRKQLHHLLDDSGLKKVLLLQKNNLMKIKNVEKLIETITNLEVVSMDEMLEKLSILADLSDKEGDAEVELTGGNFVHIMTIHGSKGLEFPVVFVPDLSRKLQSENKSFRYDIEGGLSAKFKMDDEQDLLADQIEVSSPNFKSIHELTADQAIEESKRLFYVALTRARDLLILSSKDKGKRNTWYSWLEGALSQSEQLEQIIEIKEGSPEQEDVQEKKGVFEGSLVKLERSIPISFSVSEVMSYLNDSDAFIEKHLLKLDEIWMEESEDTDEFIIDDKLAEDVQRRNVDSRTLGTLVHRICELLDKGFSSTEAYQEAFAALADDEKSTYLSEVQPLIQSYQSIDFGQAVENEWEFVLNIDGIHIIGEIDKVVLKNGHFEVLDLKTNHLFDNVEELMAYYKPQLYLYKMAYEQQEQAVIKRMALVFLRDHGQGVYEVNYDPEYKQHIITEIHKMAELKKVARING